MRGNEFRQQGRRKERGERRESGAKRGWRKAFWAGRLEGGNRRGDKRGPRGKIPHGGGNRRYFNNRGLKGGAIIKEFIAANCNASW